MTTGGVNRELSTACDILNNRDMHTQLEQKMREIIRRKWDSTQISFFSREVYDELVQAGIDVPQGAMHKIFEKWESQGLIALARPMHPEQEIHGSVHIARVSDSF